MSSCCDRCWCAQSPLHLPVKLAEVILGPVQAVCAEAQCNRRTVLHLSRARGEDLSSADLFLRAEPKPGCESRGIAEPRHVWPNLVCAVIVLMPGTSVRSMPAIRNSSAFRSNAASLPARR